MSKISIIGIILILAGAFVFAYPMFTYTKQDKIAQIGDIKVTADTLHAVSLPPALGAALLLGGIVLVIVGRGK